MPNHVSKHLHISLFVLNRHAVGFFGRSIVSDDTGCNHLARSLRVKQRLDVGDRTNFR